MSLISGNVTFNSGSTNYSANSNVIVGASTFCGDAQNCGLISSGYFFDTAINAGTISSSAVFAGTAVNSGTASIAIFSGNAINCSSVTTCAIFVDTAVNAGSVTYASFCGSGINNGIVSQSGLFYGSAVNSGSVCGNAIFADTATNAIGATVCGNADFATGSYNGGTVNGNTGVYTPAFFNDTSSCSRAVILNGGVIQFDENNGVKGADFCNGGTLVGSMIDLAGGSATIEGFYCNAFANSTIINLGTLNSPAGYHLYFTDQGTIAISNGWNSTLDTYMPYQANAWTHWAFVFNETILKIYRNGDYQDEWDLGILSGADKFSLGNYFGSATTQFYGKIAGLRITNTEVYTQNFSPTSLPENISGTQLLLNFGASSAPNIDYASYKLFLVNGTSYFETQDVTCGGLHDTYNGKIYINFIPASATKCFSTESSYCDTFNLNCYCYNSTCVVDDYCTCTYSVDDYCTCTYSVDDYCTCIYDIYNENNECIGTESCQVCCGNHSESCQVCCGNHSESCQVCCGNHNESYSVCGGGGTFCESVCVTKNYEVCIFSGFIDSANYTECRSYLCCYYDNSNGCLCCNQAFCLAGPCDGKSYITSYIRCAY